MPRASLLLLAALALLGSCHKKPDPAPPAPRVALWEITDPDHPGTGPRGWLFGTVHALPEGAQWRRTEIDQALAASDRLVLEIAEPLNQTVAGQALARLAYTPGLPPPSQRVSAPFRTALGKVYADLSLSDENFRDEESWAVALQLAAIAGQKHGMDPDRGAEPELRRLAGNKPVAGLETIDGQFGVFDALPDRAQLVLLEQVANEAATNADDEVDMVALWLRGDDLGIARESLTGFLADPTVRGALLTGRNVNWADQLDAMLKSGAKPFVAVGAAHVSGSDGLPRMLTARGWKVRRLP
jgi:uncharacterized protein YbaP (TraB family)